MLTAITIKNENNDTRQMNYRVGQKGGHKLMNKFAVKWILKIAPHLAYVATLPCETLMSAKRAINDKLH